MQKTKIFVFGASGFVGSNLTQYLKGRHNVITVGRHDEDVFFDLETSSPKHLEAIVEPGDSWVFLAAISSPVACADSNASSVLVNVTNTLGLIRFLTSLGVRVVFSSSDAVFGNKTTVADDEDHLAPCGNYGVMKGQVEDAVKDDDLVKVVRFSYIVGKGDAFTSMLCEAENSGVLVDVFKGFDRNIILLSDVLLGIEIIIQTWSAIGFKTINFSGPSLVSRDDLVSVLTKDIFPKLRVRLSEAPDQFWAVRSKTISTDCRHLTTILGRAPHGIESIKEFW